MKTRLLNRRASRTRFGALAGVLLTGLLAAAAPGHASTPVSAPPPCTPPTSPPAPVGPTTVSTLEQAYYCVLANYFSGSVLDDRTLLVGAFGAFTQELEVLGLDRPDAALPALTGDHDADWQAFGTVYQQVLATLPSSAQLRQQVAAATMTGMVASLNDNHAHWQYFVYPPGAQPGDDDGLGLHLSTPPVAPAIAVARAPLYVTGTETGSPAAAAGLLPGDIIDTVNDVPPFANGVLSAGVMNWLAQVYPSDDPVRLTLTRPATGRTWTVTLRPTLFKSAPPSVTASVVHGDIADIQLPGFYPNAANDVLAAIANLRRTHQLRGVVLDLRGNGGGSPVEVAALAGAFIHGKVTGYLCTVSGACTPSMTNDSVPLVHLKLAVLTDRACASACDAFTDAVRDLRLGPVIGTRTAGVVAGPAGGFLLTDNSILIFPTQHSLGANREPINDIGVAPDHYLPRTAQDLSTGHDPDLALAVHLLTP